MQMKKFFIKPYRWAIIFISLLIGMFSYVLLDTFVIPKPLTVAAAESSTNTTNTTNTTTIASTTNLSSVSSTTSSTDSTTSDADESQTNQVITENSYEDDNIKINIETIRKYDSTIYVADIQVSDISYLKTALAYNTYGRNIKATTSEIAEENNAIFAINGDFYGFRNSGYVLRNGVAYRDSARSGTDNEDLVIDNSGNFSIINENEESMDSLISDAWQIFSFGPALVENGEIVVNSSSEVSQSMNSNPRTAIGEISPLHYIFIVSDGRTQESAGLSLLELAQEFAERGCTTAYNLDGGGSSTMYFNGEVINNPTNGRSSKEREVSDIVYFGY